MTNNILFLETIHKRTRFVIMALVLLASTCIPLLASRLAHAYVTPYYINEFDDGAPDSISTGAIRQGQQLVKHGDVYYYADTGTGLIVKTQGTTHTIISGRTSPSSTIHQPEEGLTARDSSLLAAGIEVGADGTLYVADAYANRVFSIGDDNILHVVAGNGDGGGVEDAPDAKQTPFADPNYVKFGPDGLLYVSDCNVVRRINADGSVTRIAGTQSPNNCNFSGALQPITEGAIATDQALTEPLLNNKITPMVLNFDSAGRLHIGTRNALIKLEADGTLHSIVKSTLYDNAAAAQFTREEQPLSEKVFPTEFTGFDFGTNDEIWITTATHAASESTGSYGGLFRIHDGLITSVAGGGGSNAPAYGNKLRFNYASAPLVTSQGVYLMVEAYAGYTAFAWNKNPNYTNDQQAPQYQGNSFSPNPKLVSETSTLSVQFADPGEGQESSGVAGAEYFVGENDPGEGNGTPLVSEGTGFAAPFGPNSLPVGSHSIRFRAVDNAGNWSTTFADTLIVQGAPTFTSDDSLTTNVRTPFSFTVSVSGGLPPSSSLSEAGALPTGVTFANNGDGLTGTLSGQPAVGTEGTYPITFTADNGSGATVTQNFTLTITANDTAPTFVSPPNDTETYGVPFSFQVNTSGFPAPTITKTGTLPPGVTFTNNGDGTATIAGTPNKSALGDYVLTLKAKNTSGTVTQTFTLTIAKVPVFVKTPVKKAGRVGMPLTFNVNSSGYFTPVLYADNLPLGLTFTDNGDGTGLITGTPEPDAAGSTTVTLTAANQEGYTTRQVTFNIKGAPTFFTTEASTTVAPGAPFSFQFGANGFPLPKFTKTGALPQGVTFDNTTGTLSGTPNTIGTYPITVKAKNTFGSTTQAFTLVVNNVVAD